MGKIDQEDQAENEEKHAAKEGDVVAPELEERVGNEEGDHDEGEPGDDFRAPVAILQSGARVLGRGDAEE